MTASIQLGWFLLRVVWLGAPVLVGGVLLVASIKLDLWPGLARPIDRGWSPGGKRVFGDNKTYRGLVVMPVTSALAFGVQVWLAARSPALRELGFFDYRATTWWAHGAALGLGYALAELPNSFLKRRLDIAPGASGKGKAGIFFAVLDQLDSAFGVWAALYLLFVPTWEVVLGFLGMFLFIHVVVFNVAMVLLGLKRRPI